MKEGNNVASTTCNHTLVKKFYSRLYLLNKVFIIEYSCFHHKIANSFIANLILMHVGRCSCMMQCDTILLFLEMIFFFTSDPVYSCHQMCRFIAMD